MNAQVNVASHALLFLLQPNRLRHLYFFHNSRFVSDVQYFRQEFATRPDLGDVAVWVTENNVNADYDSGNGYSACNPTQKFVTDQRGTSAFFAAWRPYAFSQLGKAGNQAIYHWDYPADAQFGEVNYTRLEQVPFLLGGLHAWPAFPRHGDNSARDPAANHYGKHLGRNPCHQKS